MPVGSKPVLELTLLWLKKYGITDIILATGYLEELIRFYFKDGEALGVQISYSREDQPLGTAGPLDLVREHLKQTFLVVMADVITDLNLDDLYRFHSHHRNHITVALSSRQETIDYGIVHLKEDGLFEEWQEKPALAYLVSAGIYLFEPFCLQFIPPRQKITIPELIQVAARNQGTVRGFKHEGYWLDIGRPDDYARACRDFETGKFIL